MILAHLEYPQYLQYILGPWEVACAAALLAPGLPCVKEWACAGTFFKYSAAFLSYLYVAVDRRGFGASVSAAAMTALTVISWALRPSDRRLPESNNVAWAMIPPSYLSHSRQTYGSRLNPRQNNASK